MKPQPLFSMTTAYKQMMDFHRIDNTIYALVLYTIGDVVKTDGFGIYKSLYSVETYEFPNSKYCELGTGLFDKIMDYEKFLYQEHVDNKKVWDLSKPLIDAFNIKYKKQPGVSWWKKFSANLTMDNIETKPVLINPYEKHHVWHIPENSHDLVSLENIRPVFKSAVYQQSSKDIAYVYELELIKAINLPNVYFTSPCINISLFDNNHAANQYVAQSVIKQQNFAKHKEFQELQNKCMPAIMRFDMFANSRNLSR